MNDQANELASLLGQYIEPVQTGLELPSEGTTIDLQAVIADISSDLQPLSKIAEIHGVTEAYLNELKARPEVAKLIQESKKAWEGRPNSLARIQYKARYALEESIAELYKMAVDSKVKGFERVNAIKELKEIAGVIVDNKGAGAGLILPNITINLGGKSVSVANAGPSPDIVDVTPSNNPTLDMFKGLTPLFDTGT